jgi:UDP-N-acetylglucosamine/UDP-N-acetylgalactosamine diphosphorylase
MKKSSISLVEIERLLQKNGQTRILSILSALSASAKDKLLGDLAMLDWAALESLLNQKPGATQESDVSLEPANPYVFSPGAREEIKAGESLIKSGAVGLFTVAGGQGTRLGFEGPKGCFQATPVRKATLFQVFAEKIRAAELRYGVTLPWVIMTSPQNDAETKKFFESEKYFGLKGDQFFFFVQGVMPSVDATTGELLMASGEELVLSPDGHGGSVKGLYKSGALEWLKQRKISTLSYFQVDNPLVKIIDPLFLGAHHLSSSDFSSKTIPKVKPEERVGVFAKRGGVLGVVEYSELPKALAEARNAKGELAYSQGNLAAHCLEVDFLQNIAATAALPYHLAVKKIPFWDGEKLVSPEKPNAIKYEQFIFDALPFAKNPILYSVAAEEEKAFIKNAVGEDSPETSIKIQIQLWTNWLKNVGVEVPVDASGNAAVRFEISPVFADSVEALKEQEKKGNVPAKISEGLVLE